MAEAFDTSPVLFISMVAVYLLISMFVLGGWGAFFEPFKKSSEDSE
ncbi:MAG TPA: hypothetical protein PKD05_00670 [Candidatus Melainabacteria bacterium]|nr:hypothetical protein [Cyanobacteria bacterium HKST-UBA01]MCB9470986.1 hypothetical protein [Candidatus Obscuribacterales bacterium]HMP50046.1 hypothetical protein [Candidatus Melainabacteria bacterium]